MFYEGTIPSVYGHMKFAKYNCERLELRGEVPRNQFKMKEFKGNAASVVWGREFPKEPFLVVCNTRNRRASDFHAHFQLAIKGGTVRFRIEYIRGATKRDRDEPPPYAEDVARWFQSFLKETVLSTSYLVVYAFPNWPLGMVYGLPGQTFRPSRLLEGARMDGFSLKAAPNRLGISRLIFQSRKKGSLVVANVEWRENSRTFKPFLVLRKISPAIHDMLPSGGR